MSGLNSASSPKNMLFAALRMHFITTWRTAVFNYSAQPRYKQAFSDYSSYAFNGGNARTNSNAPGIAGRNISSIKDPTKSVLVAESSAFTPWSWHKPKKTSFSCQRNLQ